MKNKAFTLIELLVVILIIGILAAIAYPKYQLAIDKSKYAQAMALLAQINSAQQRYRLQNNKNTTSFYDLDINLPSSGKITQPSDGGVYSDKWGYCKLHINDYGQCNVKIESARVWYFLRWASSASRSCWVEPKDNKRGNRLCQAMTGQTSGKESGDYMIYYFPQR